MEIIKQRSLSMTYNGERLWFEENSEILEKIGLSPNNRYSTDVKNEDHIVMFTPSDKGNKITEKVRRGKTYGVVDRTSSDIKEALKGCTNIKITYYIDEPMSENDTPKGRVVIQGFKNTAKEMEDNGLQEEERQLTSITFCAGSGVSASCNIKAGFKENAYVEWNPKTGKEDKFANIFAENHPGAVMFNIPMQQLSAADLPYSDLWMFSLDCTDYSNLASSKNENQFITMHLFMHVMRLFWEKPVLERPKAIMIENVPNFQKVAGVSLKLALEEEGFHVTMAELNSLDYMSRTQRKRFFLVATPFEGFEMPKAIGRLDTPIIDDGVMTLENLEWETPDTSATLKHFIEREGNITHNHKILSYDITKDTHVGTIPKSHYKLIPENLIKHPTKPNTYAFIRDVEHLKYLHGIEKDYYLGESRSTAIQCIGQGVDCNTFYSVVKKLHDFLVDKMFNCVKKVKETKYEVIYRGEQLSFAF